MAIGEETFPIQDGGLPNLPAKQNKLAKEKTRWRT